jgi:hypothetical protein
VVESSPDAEVASSLHTVQGDTFAWELHSSWIIAHSRGMNHLDGGRLAASGFQYQYIKTVERVLPWLDLDSPTDHVLVVEGDPAAAMESSQQVIDFHLRSGSGVIEVAAQVKWKSPGRLMAATEAFSILLRLIAVGEAKSYELLTNSGAGPGLP